MNPCRLPSLILHNESGREASMKKIVWFVGGMAAAAAGFLVWNSNRTRPLHEPSYNLDENASDDSSDNATFV